jgi:hypothetical protein
MNNVKRCILTGLIFDNTVQFDNSNPLVIDYKYLPLGRVRIAVPTYNDLLSNKQFSHPVLAGICRNAFEDGVEPPLINGDFLTTGIKNYKYPTEFKEKGAYLLKYLYHKGGKDYHTFSLKSMRDFPICYSSDIDEFNRIMDFLESNFLIKWQDAPLFGRSMKSFHEVQLTEVGIEEVEKELPSIPMVGLVSQKITTGDFEIDDKINHAQDLFFQEPRTLDKMRSACETLSYVLEPLRKDLEKYFKQKDISDFFQIVNNFDIRHNKESTKVIMHEEQLEWVYYSLLNTINTYTKLRRKL